MMSDGDTVHTGVPPSEGNFSHEYPFLARFISQFDPYQNPDLKTKARHLYDDTAKIRALFGAFDGLIISYSTFKYIFDLITPADGSASTALHDWMETPHGASLVTLETVAIIALSMIGNIFSDEDKNPLIRGMAWFWPYFRDAFKGLKFAYKGVRSVFQVASAMGLDFQKMLLPVGLFLGVLAGANRLWYRNQVTEKRKDYQKTNNKLLKRAQNLGARHHYDIQQMPDDDLDPDTFENDTIYLTIDEAEDTVEYKVKDPSGELVQGKFSLLDDLGYNAIDHIGKGPELTVDYLKKRYLKEILAATHSNGHTAMPNDEANRAAIRAAMKDQSLPSRPLVMASALFGGFADGLYTYMGAMGIAVLSPPLFAVMVVCSVLFTALCIINRYHEENEFQNDFERSRLNVELVLLTQEITELFSELHRIHKIEAFLKPGDPRGKEYDDQHKILELEFDRKMAQLDATKAAYDSLIILSTQRAVLAGLRSGLYFYSAISSIIFVFAAGYALMFTAFPPALLVFGALAGVMALIGFVIHAVMVNNEHTNEHNANVKPRPVQPEHQLRVLFDKLKNYRMKAQDIMPTVSQERDALIDSLHMDPSPQFHFQEAFEVLRSFCSGLAKGPKAGDYSLNELLEKDDHGRLQETPIVVGMGLAASALYGVVYGLRAFGKNFRAANDVPIPKLPEADALAVSVFDHSPFTSRQGSSEDVDSGDGPGDSSPDSPADSPRMDGDASPVVLSQNEPSPLRVRSRPIPMNDLSFGNLSRNLSRNFSSEGLVEPSPLSPGEGSRNHLFQNYLARQSEGVPTAASDADGSSIPTPCSQ